MWSGWRGHRWDGWDGWDRSDGWEGSQWSWPSSNQQSSPPEAAVEPPSEPVRPWWMDSPVPGIPSPRGRPRRWGSEQRGYDESHSQVSQEIAEPTSAAARWLASAPTPAPSPAPTPPEKIVVLGMPKCGTTSLHESFKRAGFRCGHFLQQIPCREEIYYNLYGNMNCQNADGFQTAWSLKIILVWLKMIDPIKYMA